MRRWYAAAVVAAALFAGAPKVGVGEVDRLPDYDCQDGHFYSQAAGDAGVGFRVVDGDLPFWTAFQRLGGVERLGYPISKRFQWDGTVVQAMQKGVLQALPDGQVGLVSVIDLLTNRGYGPQLRQHWLVPPEDREAPLTAGVADTQRFLAEQGPELRPFLAFYATAADPLALYGLPTSLPVDLGDLFAIRFQRSVLQLWKVHGPGVAPGLVTSLNVGEVLKGLALLPASSLIGEAPPRMVAAGERRGHATGRGMETPSAGKATWYGNGFHGRRMRNGEIFDLNDPNVAASNTYPLGTWLRVTNLENGASVDVRVTDTGAFRPPILLDLSWAAFAQLDNPNTGVIDVLIRPLHRE